MGSLVVWCLLSLVLAIAVTGTAALAESTGTGGRLEDRRRRLVVLAGLVVVLVVLGLILKVAGIARLDGDVVTVLSHSRGATLAAIASVLTTLGDTIPSLTIAAVLSVILARRGNHPALCWILPIVVLVELVVQIGMGHLFNDLNIGDVAPHVTNGNFGYVPSGSIARLSSLFFVTAMLWGGRSREARSWVSAGAALVVLQAVTRLYLGRHLVLDIVGGLALGLALTLLVSLLLPAAPVQIDGERGHEQQQR